jgi:hypothetical protein
MNLEHKKTGKRKEKGHLTAFSLSSQLSAGTIQFEKGCTVWRAWFYERNNRPWASTGGGPNGAVGD